MSDQDPPDWLLLAASLPGRDAGTARVRLWRTLKDAGAATLRDGVTLIPASATARERISDIVRSIEKQGGAAWLFMIPTQAPRAREETQGSVRSSSGLRSRDTSDRRLAQGARDARRGDGEAPPQRDRRRISRSRRARLFPGSPAGADQREPRPIAFGARPPLLQPEEPSMAKGSVTRRDVRGFQRALWATRKRLWVDRVSQHHG